LLYSINAGNSWKLIPMYSTGLDYRVTIPAQRTGTVYYKVTARDVLGYGRETGAYAYEVQDSTKPVVIIQRPATVAESTTSQSWIIVSGQVINAKDVGLKNVTCNTGAENTGTLEEWTFKVSLTKGVNTITIAAEDQNGKLASDSIEITYAPSLPAKARAFKSGRAPSPTATGTYTFKKKERDKTRKTKSPPKSSATVLNKKSDSSGDWSIQIESLKNKKFADQIITELKNEGYPAYYITVTSPGKSTWYKIRTGSYKNKAEARRALNRLKKYQDRAIIVFNKTTKIVKKKKESTVENKEDQQPKTPASAVPTPKETSSPP